MVSTAAHDYFSALDYRMLVPVLACNDRTSGSPNVLASGYGAAAFEYPMNTSSSCRRSNRHRGGIYSCLFNRQRCV